MENMTSSQQVGEPTREKTFFGQPWGLANLFGVEMWERFSFYGMQAILVYYMYFSATEGGLGMDKAQATSIIGAYGGLVYMASLAAALVADRFLGSERTLSWSAVLVMLGHISLSALPGVAGLAVGLIAIALGSGGIKTNASVVLGQLYSRTDPRRDAGFSIFYLGINIGALAGPILTGWLRVSNGFHWGFGLAAVGMAIGLTQYILMRKTTIGAAGHEVPNPLPKRQYPLWFGSVVAIVVVCVLLIGTGTVKVQWLSDIVTVVALISAVVLWCQMYFSPLTTATEKSRLIGFIPIFISGSLFFGVFQQQFTVIAIFAETRLDRNVLGVELAPEFVQSINPTFIILFSVVFATLWTKLGDRQWSSPVKFGVANVIIGISLFFFLPFVGGEENSTPVYAIVWILFLFTMAELLLSPVGQSLVTKLAPEAFKTQMVALFFLTVSIGSALSGVLAGYYNPDDAGAERSYFLSLGLASIVVAAAIAALSPWIKKNMMGVR